MTSLSAFGAVLLVIAGIMLDSHRRTWHIERQNDDTDEKHRRASRARYSRRMLTSGLIALMGALLLVHTLIPERPLPYLLYLFSLVLLCGAIILLGFIEWFAISVSMREAREQSKESRKQLESEIRKLRKRD